MLSKYSIMSAVIITHVEPRAPSVVTSCASLPDPDYPCSLPPVTPHSTGLKLIRLTCWQSRPVFVSCYYWLCPGRNRTPQWDLAPEPSISVLIVHLLHSLVQAPFPLSALILPLESPTDSWSCCRVTQEGPWLSPLESVAGWQEERWAGCPG